MKRRRGRHSRRLPALGLPSLLLVSGCLDEAPEFPERGQIPPFVLIAQVTPPVSQIYADGFPMEITVPFRSEDVNEDVIPILYLDLTAGQERPPREATPPPIPASTYDNVNRSFRFTLNAEPSRGCHSLTLILTYESNLNTRGLPRDEERTARVIWWLDVDEDTTGNVTLRSCPRAN